MRGIGNLIWFLCGGFIIGLLWLMAGIVWCITIIGIPVGLQCFKLSSLCFFPFKKKIIYHPRVRSACLNIIWLVTGIPLAVISAAFGMILCASIIGIPFGLQHFKIAKLSLMPFDTEIMTE